METQDRIRQLEHLGLELHQAWAGVVAGPDASGQWQGVLQPDLMPASRALVHDLLRMNQSWTQVLDAVHELLDPGMPWHWNGMGLAGEAGFGTGEFSAPEGRKVSPLQSPERPSGKYTPLMPPKTRKLGKENPSGDRQHSGSARESSSAALPDRLVSGEDVSALFPEIPEEGRSSHPGLSDGPGRRDERKAKGSENEGSSGSGNEERQVSFGRLDDFAAALRHPIPPEPTDKGKIIENRSSGPDRKRGGSIGQPSKENPLVPADFPDFPRSESASVFNLPDLSQSTVHETESERRKGPDKRESQAMRQVPDRKNPDHREKLNVRENQNDRESLNDRESRDQRENPHRRKASPVHPDAPPGKRPTASPGFRTAPLPGALPPLAGEAERVSGNWNELQEAWEWSSRPQEPTPATPPVRHPAKSPAPSPPRTGSSAQPAETEAKTAPAPAANTLRPIQPGYETSIRPVPEPRREKKAAGPSSMDLEDFLDQLTEQLQRDFKRYYGG